jgi:hypothetical protein
MQRLSLRAGLFGNVQEGRGIMELVIMGLVFAVGFFAGIEKAKPKTTADAKSIAAEVEAKIKAILTAAK